MSSTTREEELFERLVRILENQSISLTSDVAQELVRELSESTVSAEDMLVVDEQSRGSKPIEATPGQSSAPVVAANDRSRPTPYQVWAARHDSSFSRKPPLKLSEKGWEKLVDNLHNSESVKKKVLMHQQHQNLADELQHLSFKPELNRNSKVMAKEVQPLSSRQSRMLKTRAEHLLKQREERLQKEMEPCTFNPQLEASNKSQVYLRKAKKEHRTVDDYFQFEADVRRKRVELKKQLEEEESQELTFQPQLSRTSHIMVQKLKKMGRMNVDPSTGQTLLSGKRVVTYTNEDLGHEEETFTPVIGERTAQFMTTRRGTDGTIFERLYESGMHRTIKIHNHKVATYKERFKNFFPSRSYDKQEVEEGVKAAWVDDVQQRKEADRERADQAFLDLHDKPTVHVVPYTTKYMELFQNLRPDFLVTGA